MTNNVNELYNRLVAEVLLEDEEIQREYLSMVEDYRHISVDYLLSVGAVFIPNDEYIAHFLGQEIKQTNNCFYFNGRCLWSLFVIFPVRDLSGAVVAINGWDAYNKYLERSGEEQGLSMYKLSSKAIFPKERHFFADTECLKSTFDTRVIFITDGMFDTLAMSYRGIPAMALLGSSFSPEILYFLRWYHTVYVCSDNDAAGLRLYNELKKSLPRVFRVCQNKTKDIEELLRSDGFDGPITKTLISTMSDRPQADVYLSVGNRRFKGARVSRPNE